MQRISLPDALQRPLSFYLAMEEYVAAAYGCGFFVWRVPPTVIIGRNQDLESEVNLPFCREHGVRVVRRKSGGGCVYADLGNLMLSYITPQKGVELVFGEFLGRLCSFLSGLGLEAVRSEHNDVLVGGRKVSGNAFFVHPKASIVHGTLLHSVDFDMLQQAITPSAAKLEKHAVRSVRQRVANLSSLGLGLSAEELSEALLGSFCDSALTLDASEVRRIEEIEKSYEEESFLLGKAP